MPYASRYIDTAAAILGTYDGRMPFHHFLKQFFAADKKYGSKDRKAIAHACYCYYRLGNALGDLATTERTRVGVFLCNEVPGVWQEAVPGEWLQHWSERLAERVSFIGTKYSFDIDRIFPLHEQLSSEIDKDSFIVSYLTQPDLFIRIRPGKKEVVYRQLSAAGISFDTCGDDCIALPNGTKADKLLSLDHDAVIQDRSSQRVAELFPVFNKNMIKVWDCCAASGGKSILACDVLKNVRLTVSDVRASIIHNLEKRFAEAGITKYNAFVSDLVKGRSQQKEKFDLVICDAPCSGSGTWGRTPEQLSFFTKEKMDHYVMLQRNIAGNVISSLAEDGYLLYITCSVFRAENEDVVEYIRSGFPVQLQEMRYIKGYSAKADTMFAALFTAAAP